jgi:transcriptional regulator NrdR family protein
MTEVVKRRGRKEKFDEKKIYGSVYAACHVAHMGERNCESVAAFVTKKVKTELKKKKTVTSKEIAKRVAENLKRKSKDAAFLYKTHRDVA